MDFYNCQRLTGTAELGYMSEVHICLIRLAASRSTSFLPHFILFPLFAFPPAGDVGKIVLPEGMQSVDFTLCKGLTGTLIF